MSRATRHSDTRTPEERVFQVCMTANDFDATLARSGRNGAGNGVRALLLPALPEDGGPPLRGRGFAGVRRWRIFGYRGGLNIE